MKAFRSALADVDAATAWIRNKDFVDSERLAAAGQSRGGKLSIVHAAQRPTWYRAVINFVGAWNSPNCGAGGRTGTGRRIGYELARRAANTPVPSIWLYSDGNTKHWSTRNGRKMFKRFQKAGGTGIFQNYALPSHHHGLIYFPEFWLADMTDYLLLQDLPFSIIPPPPADASSR